MFYKFKMVTACSLLLLCSACAFTVHDLPINYSYNQSIDMGFSPNTGKTISVQSFEDDREIANPRMIMHMKNMNGDTTTGGWQAEKPVADIVRDAIIDGLKSSGMTYSQSAGSISLYGELLDLDHKSITGFWKGTLQLKLMVKLTLKDEKNGEIIWRDTFLGRSSVQTNLKDGFIRALNDLVEEVFKDEMFQSKLKKYLV